MPFIQTLIIKSSVACGIVLAAIICFYKKELAKSLASHLSPFYLISLNKWYVDEIYNTIFTKPAFFIASFFWKRGDQKSIDALGPDGVSRLINLLARGASRIQSGFLYHYVFIMFGGLVIILSWFVYK
jgi:NADH-quinone oxidoreductase subunit L